MTRLAPTQVELEIPILPEELAAAEERAFRKLAKSAKFPGFRPGKVPRRVFEQTYGADVITNQAMDDVVPEVYAKAVREHDIQPVDRPKMELLPTHEGQPARIKAIVDVRPAIELKTYKGLRIERTVTPINDNDVERSIAALARDRGQLVPVQRAARIGDVVTVDYEGTIDGVAFEGGSAKNQVTELREDRFIPGFAAGIAGMDAGESKEICATFPPDYQQQGLAGKEARFALTLHEVKEFELPAIDDAFAKAVSQNETLEALRADVRRRLEAIAQSRAHRELGNRIVDRLVAEHDFPLPDVLVQRELENMRADMASYAARMGISFDEYLQRAERTEEQLREQSRPDAQRRVKGTLLLEAIAKAERILATPADVSAELQGLSEQYGQPVDRVRAALGNNLLSLMDGIVRTKTVEFLIDNADIAETVEVPGKATGVPAS